MAADEIRITGEPSAGGDRCKFVVDRPVLEARSAFFGDQETAKDSALASELLGRGGIDSVLIADNTLTVTAPHPVDWPALGIGNLIRKHLRGGEPVVAERYFEDLPAEADLSWAIRGLFDQQINPALAQHGGWVELIDVKKNTVFLRLGGGCQGCGAADITLKQGIERAIRDLAPKIGEILDTTDHASGRNPYYSPGK